MQLGQLEGLIAAVEERSISRAAARLFLSQPTLTSRIQALENELGVPLLARHSRGVQLTEAGEAFLPHVRRALRDLDEGRAAVRRMFEGAMDTLTIASAPTLSTCLLPTLLKRFREECPGIRVVLRTGHAEEITDMLLHNEADLGLACELHHPDLTSAELLHDELVLVAPPGLAPPPQQTDPLRLADLARMHTVVVFATPSGDSPLEQLRHLILPSGNVLELDAIDTAQKMVENALGLALLPRRAVADALADGRLVTIQAQDLAAQARHIMLLRKRSGGIPAGPAGHFLALARQYVMADGLPVRADGVPVR
ncbi:LysR family transcriptional regulator [Streptomyces sp. NPDC001508]|uniref:LysR family transcriptional regulator n=1 Tax=Streptomyces sp. NPDC001508 TaxID=3154656 RepID=UPI0033340DE9